jgi:bifunctional non-homologous end joining protein LigD
MKDVGTRCSRCRNNGPGIKGFTWSRAGLGFSRMATYFGGMLRIEPCLPSPAERPPTGPDWVHEIKHDGYRLMARRDPIGIRLLTRNGHDWSPRYPLIVEAVNRLKARSCLIDGEAVACDDNGVAVFARLRRQPSGRHVFLFAFDLLELDGEDLRREPFETRKATLAS